MDDKKPEKKEYDPRLNVPLYTERLALFGDKVITLGVYSYNGGEPRVRIGNAKVLQKSLGLDDVDDILSSLEDLHDELSNQVDAWRAGMNVDDWRAQQEDAEKTGEPEKDAKEGPVKAASVVG